MDKSSPSGKTATMDCRIDFVEGGFSNFGETSQEYDFKFGDQRITITPVLSQNQSNPTNRVSGSGEENKHSSATEKEIDSSDGFLKVRIF